MASFSWTRRWITNAPWTSVQQVTKLVALSSGQSIVRNRLAWGFGGTTSTLITPTAVMHNLATLGLVTTIGNGTESVPDPIFNMNNAAPPSQRWLYWEARAPRVAAWDSAGRTVVWENTRPEERGSTEGQVLAPSGMGTGNFLNLWMTWDTIDFWDASGAAILWCAVETLVRGD